MRNIGASMASNSGRKMAGTSRADTVKQKLPRRKGHPKGWPFFLSIPHAADEPRARTPRRGGTGLRPYLPALRSGRFFFPPPVPHARTCARLRLAPAPHARTCPRLRLGHLFFVEDRLARAPQYLVEFPYVLGCLVRLGSTSSQVTSLPITAVLPAVAAVSSLVLHRIPSLGGWDRCLKLGG